MAKKILVTAFEPFGGRGRNPSLEVLARLRAPAGARLIKARLPVSGRAVGPRVAALLKKHKPDIFVSLGLAAGEAGLRVERFGVNILDYGIKDNSGWRPEGEPVDRGGPAAYAVTLDPRRLAAAARRAGLPAYVSNHAGGYVCNTTIYSALRAIEAAGLATRYAFLHLPLTTEMVLADKPGKTLPPSLPLALLTAGAAAALAAALGETR